MRADERAFLDVILKAACSAAYDAGRHDLRPNELKLLNEQWTHSYVGIAINDELRRRHQSDSSFITFETSVGWMEEICGVEGRAGRPPGVLSPRQRFDLVVWSKGGSPVGLVETKDQPLISNYAQTADPKKICGALRRWPSLRWGAFLLSLRASKATTARDITLELGSKAERVAAAIQCAVGKQYYRHATLPTPGQGSRTSWMAVMFKRG